MLQGDLASKCLRAAGGRGKADNSWKSSQSCLNRTASSSAAVPSPERSATKEIGGMNIQGQRKKRNERRVMLNSPKVSTSSLSCMTTSSHKAKHASSKTKR